MPKAKVVDIQPYQQRKQRRDLADLKEMVQGEEVDHKKAHKKAHKK